MEIQLAYGSDRIELEFPESVAVDCFSPGRAPQPADARTLAELWPGVADRLPDRPLIVVNDAYRNTPTLTLLNWINRADSELLDRADFLVATGTHAAPTPEQLDHIFGPFLNRVRPRLNIHDARNPGLMIPIGIDRFGEEVFLNRTFAEADRPLLISSVEPHYFAGYTGGRKSIFPGLTDLATVERNHNLANSLEAQPLRLTGNPVAEHLMNLADLVNMDAMTGLQVVLDADGNIARVSAGPLHEAFLDAVESARVLFEKVTTEPYDIVICELLPPLDRNLYQIQKGLENCQAAVRDGGTIVLVSRCREGIGSRAFFDLSRNWDPETNRPRSGPLTFGSHKLSRVVNIGKRINVRVVSGVSARDVRQVYYEPLDNLDKFLFIAWNNSTNCRVAVVHDAGNTVLKT